MVLVGPAGAGKSTFAARHFTPTEVISSDFCRGLVADDESDQSANPQAFAVLHFIASRRLRRGRLTVIDATNVRGSDRRRLLHLATQHRRPATAIVFDLPLQVCLARNRERSGRQVDEDALRAQWDLMPRPASDVAREGFQQVHALSTAAEVDRALVERAQA